MISPLAYEAPSAPALDAKVSAVLDVAAELTKRTNPFTGVEFVVVTLRKPVGGYPAGHVLTLGQLHALLFP